MHTHNSMGNWLNLIIAYNGHSIFRTSLHYQHTIVTTEPHHLLLLVVVNNVFLHSNFYIVLFEIKNSKVHALPLELEY